MVPHTITTDFVHTYPRTEHLILDTKRNEGIKLPPNSFSYEFLNRTSRAGYQKVYEVGT